MRFKVKTLKENHMKTEEMKLQVSSVEVKMIIVIDKINLQSQFLKPSVISSNVREKSRENTTWIIVDWVSRMFCQEDTPALLWGRRASTVFHDLDKNNVVLLESKVQLSDGLSSPAPCIDLPREAEVPHSLLSHCTVYHNFFQADFGASGGYGVWTGHVLRCGSKD